MKLLSKTSISYLWVSFAVLTITGILLFFFLREAISEEVKEQLELELEMVTADLDAGEHIRFPLVKISEVKGSSATLPAIFKDTAIYDHIQKKKEGYYYLKQTKVVKGKFLQITIMNTYIGWDGYIQAIVVIFILMACMLVMAGAFVNYRINKKIWSPFLINLDLLMTYSVSSKKELELKCSDIDEFSTLNTVILDLTTRAKNEYVDLKEFTENVSHEIQTPLSILKSRLESISQLEMQGNLPRFLLDAKQAADRLSRVNRGLLLLAKLKNDYFEDGKSMWLDQILVQNITLMEDLFEQRGLIISQDIKPHQLFASPYLMEIMIINLLSNLRIHATPHTRVDIILDTYKMQFSNDGPPLEFPADKLFKRFGKKFNGYQGTGLGLSIVKQICTVNNWEITYNYEDNKHIFCIRF